MRIVYAGHDVLAPRGGGELSARTLLSALAGRHDVQTLALASSAGEQMLDSSPGRTRVAYRAAGFPLPHALDSIARERTLRPHLRQLIRRTAPELVLLQEPAALRVGDWTPRSRLVVFLRSLMCYGIGSPAPTALARAAGAALSRVRYARNRALLRSADLLICNSEFLRGEIERRTGLVAEVVPPFIDVGPGPRPGERTAATERRQVTLVGLDRWKGAALALELASLEKDREFLVVEGARASADLRRQAEALPNVTVVRGWVEDMEAVFARSRVVLVPSLWDEPFGRVPVEAGARGIPCIASSRGGLPEAVGEGGILLPGSAGVGAWAHALHQLDDPTVYAALCERARQHAVTMGVEASLERLRELLLRRLSLQL